MSKLAWVKWYPEKFLNGISGMPVEQIGVYTLVLNLIYDNGGPIKDDRPKIARRCYMRPSSFERVLMALVEDGKLSVVDGMISNPRAEEELETRTKVVEKWKNNLSGGAANLPEKDNENKRIDPPSATPPVAAKRGVDKESVDKKERKKDSRPAKPQDGAVYSEDFEALWRQYPRTKNTSKKDAWNFYRVMSDDRQDAVRRAVPVFTAAMRAEGRTEDKIMHMIRFLRGGVFETVAAPATTGSGAAAKPDWHKSATREQWQKILTIWSSTNDWRASWGPAPGKPGCGVPEDMIAAHNVAHRGHMFSAEQLDAFRETASKHTVDNGRAA